MARLAPEDFVVVVLFAAVSLVVPWHYQRRHGSMEGFAQTSGLPIVGGVCVLLAGALLPSSVLAGVFLLVLYAMDGNGVPWFFVSIIRYGV